MNTKKLSLSIAAAGLLAAPALLAQMNMGGMDMGGMNMNGGAHQRGSDAPAAQTPLPEPAQTVFANYFKIQTALATNSLEGVSADAAAIERSIREDAGQTFSSGEAGSAARDLAGAANLDAARQIFKRLSGALIKYADAHPEYAGHFVKVYCPMANVMWLQKDSVVNNPFLGKDQASCGQIKN